MNLIVDGVVYGFQTHGGINTLFNQVLPRIAARPDTRVHLLVPRQRAGQLPGPEVRRLDRDFLPLRSGLSWRLDQRIAPMLADVTMRLWGLWARGRVRDAVFISTYFTILPGSVPQVAFALDLNHELMPHQYANAFGTWLRRQYPRYLRAARRIVAISETTKAHVVELYGVDPSRIDVVHLASDPATFFVDRCESRLAGLKVAAPYILYVGGRSQTHKNFSALLSAFVAAGRRLKVDLVVAGSAWNRQEREQLAAMGLEERIRLIVDPDDDDLRCLYSNAAAFVYPSLYEGFGIPLLEAMACGAPVVAADTEIFREVAGDAAIYFDPRDPEDLTRALERALDAATAAEHVQRGHRRLERYSWERSAAGIYAACEKAVG